MEPAIVHLIGFPGAGKYTIAKELAGAAAAEGGATFCVVDNHHINNTVFAVLRVDGVTPLPRRVWHYVEGVRTAVLGALEELGPSDWSYVFTNVLIAGTSDEAGMRDVAALAERCARRFVPVRLHCEIDELARRIVSEERRERMKWVDADGVRAYVATRRLVDTGAHPHALDLDVTSQTPGESAAAILAHLA